MPKFRKLKLKDEKEIKKLLKQLTDKKIYFEIKKILKDKNCNCIAIEDKGKIIGFGSIIFSMVPCKGYVGKIEDIIVDGNYRGLGLGKKLMQELLKIAKKKKIKSVNLTCSSKREEARKLYESLGFKILDTSVMRLDL